MARKGQHHELDMLDVVEAMLYLREKYNASIEVVIDNESDGGEYGVLFVTSIARCSHPQHRPVGIAMQLPMSRAMVQRMPEVLHAALYETEEALDCECRKQFDDALKAK